MMRRKAYGPEDLAKLAKEFRTRAGRSRAEAAREMSVSQTSIFNAEQVPDHGLSKLRVRMIEKYSEFRVIGPIFVLKGR